MKKLGSFTIAAVISASLVLAGCGGAASSTSSSDVNSSSASTKSEDNPSSHLVGGWQTFDGTTPAYTDDEKAVFDKAVTNTDGVDYELVRVLGTQVVAGLNYAFLARGTTVTAEPATMWYVIIAYQDASGNVSLSSIAPIDLAEPKTTDKAAKEGMVGGWTIREPANAVLEPQEVGEAFSKAAESYTGATLHPIATLGSQVVSGANYLVLCEGTPEGSNTTQLYLATLYVDAQGVAQLTDVRGFDLLGYME